MDGRTNDPVPNRGKDECALAPAISCGPVARGCRYAMAAACILVVLGTLWVVHWQRIPPDPDLAKLGMASSGGDFFAWIKLQVLLAGTATAAALTAIFLASRRRGSAVAPAKAGWLLATTGVLMGAILASSAFSIHPQTAMWGFPDHWEGAAAWTGYLALFWVAWLAAADQPLMDWLAAGVVAGAAGVGVIALAQTAGWDPLLSDWGRHWIAGGHDRIAGTMRYRGNQMLVCGTLGNSNYLGSLVALAAPLALGLALVPQRSRSLRLLAASVTVLLVVILAGSQSRAGLTGVAVGMALFGWLWYRRRGGRWSLRWILAGAGVLCLAAGLLVTVDLLRGHPLLTRLTGGHMQGVEVKKTVVYHIEEDGTLFLESAVETIRIEMDAEGFTFRNGRGQALSSNQVPSSNQRRIGTIPIAFTPPSAVWSLAWLPTLDGLVLRATESSGVTYYFLAESDGFHPVTHGGGKNRFIRIAAMTPAAVQAPPGWSQMGSARGYIWSRSLPLLAACGWRGYGLDTLAFYFPQADQAGKLAAFGSPDTFVDKPHNLYLGLALGAGLPALAAFLALAALGLGRAARMGARPGHQGSLMAGLAAGLAGYLAAGLFNDSVVAVAPAFWVCLALAAGAAPITMPGTAGHPHGTTPKLDIAANRAARKYSRSELLRRVAWGVFQPLFRFSPRPAFGWRRFVLRLFGAQVGHQVHVYNSAVIYYPWNLEIGDWSAIGEWALIYNLGAIRIGQRTTVSQRAHLCAGTHDYRQAALPLLKPPITIGDQAWICADAFVGPGVQVGDGAVIGARAVVMRDVAPWTIVAGNPARLVGPRQLQPETETGAGGAPEGASSP